MQACMPQIFSLYDFFSLCLFLHRPHAHAFAHTCMHAMHARIAYMHERYLHAKIGHVFVFTCACLRMCGRGLCDTKREGKRENVFEIDRERIYNPVLSFILHKHDNVFTCTAVVSNSSVVPTHTCMRSMHTLHANAFQNTHAFSLSFSLLPFHQTKRV